MAQMETKTTYIPLSDLIEQYLEPERFLKFCKECPQYDRLWSCPPFAKPPQEYLQDYQGIYVIGTRLPISEELQEELILPESQEEAADEIILEAREKLERMLLRLEQQIPGSRAMAAGSCKYCTRCEKLMGMPCRQPGKMRYSLEALGFNVTAISEELLDMPIQWIAGRLPEYLTLVHGFLLKEKPKAEEVLAFTADGAGFCLK